MDFVDDADGVVEPGIVVEPDCPPVAAGVAMKLASVVKEAVRPVAFLQDDGMDAALPATKLIAAHYSHDVVNEVSWSRIDRVSAWNVLPGTATHQGHAGLLE